MRICHVGRISIHALLAESDSAEDCKICIYDISIHALLAESDAAKRCRVASVLQFLSTLSLRRATRKKQILHYTGLHFYPRSPCGERPTCQPSKSSCQYFYPRSPCGERLQLQPNTLVRQSISIHALLAESDAGLHR